MTIIIKQIKKILGKESLVDIIPSKDIISIQHRGNLCDKIEISLLEIRNQGLQTEQIIQDFRRLGGV